MKLKAKNVASEDIVFLIALELLIIKEDPPCKKSFLP
jgi:hypothetical protein